MVEELARKLSAIFEYQKHNRILLMADQQAGRDFLKIQKAQQRKKDRTYFMAS